MVKAVLRQWTVLCSSLFRSKTCGFKICSNLWILCAQNTFFMLQNRSLLLCWNWQCKTFNAAVLVGGKTQANILICAEWMRWNSNWIPHEWRLNSRDKLLNFLTVLDVKWPGQVLFDPNPRPQWTKITLWHKSWLYQRRIWGLSTLDMQRPSEIVYPNPTPQWTKIILWRQSGLSVCPRYIQWSENDPSVLTESCIKQV